MRITKTSFSVREFTKENIMVIRTAIDEEPTPGLAPSHSQMIMMNKDEINDIIKVLTDYAKS
jgi:hypothetical protein